MLSAPLNLSNIEVSDLFDYLYDIFQRDFVTQRTMLNGTIYINPQSHNKDDGKERAFWHLITRKQKRQVKDGNRYVTQIDRLTDYSRAKRIEWVRQMITNHSHGKVYSFYRQETNPKKDIRLYLWAHEDDFVVILQKLGKSSSFLVTSFYIDHQGKRKDYGRYLNDYQSGKVQALINCAWF
jgi:hypothetical protein